MSHKAPVPRVSVVIPAFNAADTLSDTVRSVLAGSFRDIEVIIVDDGSTDDTASIAEDLARHDSRLRIVRRDNGGLSAALNSGFAVARGDYVARLDADDLWHRSKLEMQMEFAGRHPEVAFIYTFARYIDVDGRIVRDGPRQIFPSWALCRGICESIVAGGSSALIKRSTLEKAGGCDESFRSWEDLLLQLAITAEHPIGVVPQYLVGYRIRRGSLSSDIDRMVRSWRAVRSKLLSDYPDVPSHVHDWAHGGRCAMFAEGYAWRKRHFRSAALMLEAVRYDPAWVIQFLRFRLARRLFKVRSSSGDSPSAPNFLEADPAQPLTEDPFEGQPAQQRFAAFEDERLRRLATLDVRLAKNRAQGSGPQ